MPHDDDIGTEITGPQSIAILSTDMIPLPFPAGVNYNTYRKIRKQPTIALARALTVAPIVAGNWSTEATDDASDKMVELIEQVLFPLRSKIMDRALLAGIDFGWQGWEKVFEIKNNQIVIKKLKPLLHDITDILVDPITGDFNGFSQRLTTTVPLPQSLLVPWRVEGTNWYGEPLLENTRSSYDSWIESDKGASRYDKKIAGAHFIVHYPPGQTTINGTKSDNFDVAKDLLNALESSGSIAIPSQASQFVERMNEQTAAAWSIELLSDTSAKQPSFIDRLNYIDKLLVRSLLWPERALLEGQYGTKAEASVHTGAALTNMELMDEYITGIININVVDQLLVLNFGESARSAVKLKSSPVLDERQQFLRDIFIAVLKDTVGFSELVDKLDFEALFKRLDIPSLPKEEQNSLSEMKEALRDSIRKIATPVDDGGDNQN